MAESGVVSAMVQERLGKKAMLETYKSTGFWEGLIEVISDTNKKIPTEGKPLVLRRDLAVGDELSQKIHMIGKLTGDGVEGDETLEGNEQEVLTYSQTVSVKQLRQAAKTKGREDEHSSPVKLFPQFRPMLSDWQMERRAKEAIRKLAGATTKTFSNTPTAPTSQRVKYGGNGTSTSDLDSSDIMSLTEITRCRTQAENEYLAGDDGEYIPSIGKINFGKNMFYFVALHPDSFDDIYESTRVQQMLREASEYSKHNNLIQGGDLYYNGCIMRRCEHLRETNVGHFTTWGSGSASPGARNLFMGQGALAICESNNPRYTSDNWDYANKRGVGIDVIWGCQKALYNGQDLSVIAIDVYRQGA